MKPITSNNKIFSSAEFQKDKYKFYLISLNLKSESVMLYSDEENYVICRGAEGLPTWIWTKDNVTPDQKVIIQKRFTLSESVESAVAYIGAETKFWLLILPMSIFCFCNLL